jgi:hypothetical protein
MKSVSFFCLSLIVVACNTKPNYDPSAYLNGKEKDEFVWKIIRYASKAPDGLLFEERFYPAYDSFYQYQASRHRLEAYFINDKKEHFFLLSRPAPSMVEKRVATGGKVLFDENGNLSEYEEIFRTWKMIPDTLKRRSLMLFDKMVRNEDLSSYLTKNSKGEEYIEFPDDLNYFDKEKKRWMQK